ncbi:MAG: glycogen debranching enzyme, partial [Pseudomonadota bacterium]
NTLRQRQMTNLITLLLIASGVPMLLSGDELGKSQKGNNNAYCQDNELNWIDWRDTTKNHALLEFFRKLIRFRRDNALLRQRNFSPQGPDGNAVWICHGVKLYRPDWSEQSRSLAMQLNSADQSNERESIYVIANAYWGKLTFELPPTHGRKWRRVVDTSLPPPDHIAEAGKEEPLPVETHYVSQPRSVVVLLCS